MYVIYIYLNILVMVNTFYIKLVIIFLHIIYYMLYIYIYTYICTVYISFVFHQI